MSLNWQAKSIQLILREAKKPLTHKSLMSYVGTSKRVPSGIIKGLGQAYSGLKNQGTEEKRAKAAVTIGRLIRAQSKAHPQQELPLFKAVMSKTKRMVGKKKKRDTGPLNPEKLGEVSPPGWGHTKTGGKKSVKVGGTAQAMKKAQARGDIPKKLNIFALMWSMKNKKATPHYKPGVRNVKKKRFRTEAKKATELDLAKIRKRFANVPVYKPDPKTALQNIFKRPKTKR